MSVLWIAIFEMICIAWIYGANKLNKDFNFMLDISLNSCSVVSHVMLVALWYIIPLLLITILVLSMMTFNPSNFCTSDGVIHYPDWVHAIGFFLVVVAAAQFPLWAFFSILYYLCHPARRVSLYSQIYILIFRFLSAAWRLDQTDRRLGTWRPESEEDLAGEAETKT